MKLLQLVQADKSMLSRATNLEKLVLAYAYGNDYTYNLKFTDIDFDFIGEPRIEMFTLLDALNTGTLSGSEARREVEKFARANGDLIKLICNKHLQAGIGEGTIRKYLPKVLPPKYGIQLASEVPLSRLRFPLAAELKYDGVRLLITKQDGKVTFRTRRPRLVSLPVHEELFASTLPDGVIVDTEVTLAQGKQIERTQVSGMINSAIHGNRINEHSLVFNAFDFLTIDEFNSQAKTAQYLSRRARLAALVNEVHHSALRLADMNLVSNVEEVSALYKHAIMDGYEGLILKTLDHHYQYKRTRDWIKLKETLTADLKCVSVQEGTGKYSGMVGALVCQGEVNGTPVTVAVGSGLTDYERGKPMQHYLGKTIEVKYNAVIDNSLFLPRFVMVREDK